MIELEAGDWLQEAKDCARRQWEGVGDDPDCGFTLFVDDPHKWAAFMRALMEFDLYGVIPDDPKGLYPIPGGPP